MTKFLVLADTSSQAAMQRLTKGAMQRLMKGASRCSREEDEAVGFFDGNNGFLKLVGQRLAPFMATKKR